MFSTARLFATVACPDGGKACKRRACPFSHAAGAARSAYVVAADAEPAKASAKRPAELVASSSATTLEPPRKVLRVAGPQQQSPVRVPVAPVPSTSSPTPKRQAPVLRVNVAQSKVALPKRQAMLTQLHAQFEQLYANISERHPTLASEHATAQEIETHDKTTPSVYSQTIINLIGRLKKREPPDSVSHPSVGTEGEVAARAAARDEIKSFVLTPAMLEPHLMSEETMQELGYIIKVPDDWGPGGENPNAEGTEKECDRCKGRYVVRADPDGTACNYHWGRRTVVSVSGDRHRMHTCCNELVPGKPCETGPHVFIDSDPKQLHQRHPFSYTDSGCDGTTLDIAALDCEMIYTTGGLSLARVSVVDGKGTTVYDELVKMDDGVTVIDLNTRFSGVKTLAAAAFDLAGTREALRNFISPSTILIGHALDNDLRSLRMMHKRCIDTVALFPHRSGLPFRRALRDLTREHLNRVIQGAGADGHSSVEDSIAALDLVKFWILNKTKA
ncbi:hypothetical protein AURDEDRAFT_80132 [Auricularia subglabra TFB-10046 SS5]|nr:hypothetical protein AURDEDRAFT_80132 [Auricularia subglabra TFB-10046 SS5]